MRILGRALVVLAVLVALAVAALFAAAPTFRERADGPFPVRAGVLRVRNAITDVYGLRTGQHVVLFDVGIDVGGGALDRLLEGLHAGRTDVAHVFLTHGHFDHVAHAPLCTAASIHIGGADIAMVTHSEEPSAIVPRVFIKVMPTPAFRPDAVHEGTFSLTLEEGHPLLAIPTPGHTNGSYVYLYQGVLIAGDTIQIDGDHLGFAIPMASIDMAENRRSIAALDSLLHGQAVEVVCTGHQGCTPEGKGGAMLAALMARARTSAD